MYNQHKTAIEMASDLLFGYRYAAQNLGIAYRVALMGGQSAEKLMCLYLDPYLFFDDSEWIMGMPNMAQRRKMNQPASVGVMITG